MKIEVVKYKDINSFLEANEDSLLKNESLNNLILGLASRMKTNPDFGDGQLFYSILNDGKITAQVLRSHVNKPLAITRMENDDILKVIEELKKEEIKIHGVIGPVESSEFFSRKWGIKWKLDMYQGIYELKDLIMPNHQNKMLHQASYDDFEICKIFLEGFIKDAFPKDDNVTERALEIAERNIKEKKLYLLKNEIGDFVSMAANVRESRNAGTVSLVYTPCNFRGCGYGSLITAMVSAVILKNGKKKCNLFTDLTNATSNSIYQKIGYKKIGENKHFSFI